MRMLVLALAAFLLTTVANATASDSPQKICAERYNTENSGGTVPPGMSKSRYISQCVGSIRRAAKLEQDLAEGTAGGDDAATTAGGNVATTSTTTTKPAATTSKPPRIQTTLSLTPKGS